MDQKELLVQRLSQQLRSLSTETILFHEAVASRLELHVTDHKCLDILAREGAMSAGELARRTGLTNGAITFAVDRLEKKGLAERLPDSRDRRRVMVAVVDGPMAERLREYFFRLDSAITANLGKYSQTELGVIVDFAVTIEATLISERRSV